MNRVWLADMRHPVRWADAALGGLFIYAGFAKAINPQAAIDGINTLMGSAKAGA